mgnify:CR=1 FL=1|jgi:tryptophan synthase alpha subunit
MKKIITLAFSAMLLGACTPKMDACECGKKIMDKDSKESIACTAYMKTLSEKGQEAFMEKAMKCYANEHLGTDLK